MDRGWCLHFSTPCSPKAAFVTAVVFNKMLLLEGPLSEPPPWTSPPPDGWSKSHGNSITWQTRKTGPRPSVDSPQDLTETRALRVLVLWPSSEKSWPCGTSWLRYPDHSPMIRHALDLKTQPVTCCESIAQQMRPPFVQQLGAGETLLSGVIWGQDRTGGSPGRGGWA